MENKEKELIAKKIMECIMLDNGAINRIEKEKYPKKHIINIGNEAGYFFDNYPDLLNNEFIEEITMGFEDDVNAKYDKYNGFESLRISICDYFDEL